MNVDKLTNTAFYMRGINVIPFILVLIGCLNWGSIGVSDYNFIADIFGHYDKVVYLLVGISGFYLFISTFMQSLK